MVWNRSQIAFKKKWQNQLLKKARFSLPFRWTALGLCIAIFVFFIHFYVRKSTYISKMYILHQKFFVILYTHEHINKIWIYSRIYIHTRHSRDSSPQRISVLLPFFGILHALCFAQGFSSNSHPTCLRVCSWLPMRRPRKQAGFHPAKTWCPASPLQTMTRPVASTNKQKIQARTFMPSFSAILSQADFS